MIIYIRFVILALHTREIAITEHELNAVLGSRGQPNKNLIFFNLFLNLLMLSSQSCSRYLLVHVRLFSPRLLLVHLTEINTLDAFLDVFMQIHDLVQLVNKLATLDLRLIVKISR